MRWVNWGARARTWQGCLAAVLAVRASPAWASDAGSPAAPDEPRSEPAYEYAPSGAPIETPLRPSDAMRDTARAPACSFRLPICVHGADGAATLRVLASAERAWDVVTGVLDLPAPDPDIDTRAFDVYLAPAPTDDDEVTSVSNRDPRSRFDRASAFTVIDPRVVPLSCPLDVAMTQAIARASLLRVAPATDRASARAEVAYFTRLLVPCAAGAVDDIDVFQRHVDHAIVDPWLTSDPIAGARFDRGALFFYWWLDSSYGDEPGSIVRAIWSLTPTRTPLDAARWNAEPDAFDVLRMSFKDALSSGSTLEELFAEFGATRALVGPRENGAEVPEARFLGDLIAPPIAWTIDWPATPRRLASPVGIEATGSAYVLVRHAGAAHGARLRLEATWEEHASIRWVVVKLDAHGRETGRVPVVAPPRATNAQATIADIDDVDSFLIAATNVGDPFEPCDPDQETFEPHGWLLTLGVE